MGGRASGLLAVAVAIALALGCGGGTPLAPSAQEGPPGPGEGASSVPQAGPSPALQEATGRGRICLDPGHDARYPGASARDATGRVLFDEHVLTLQVAYRLKPLLEAQGFLVCVTRDEQGELLPQGRDEDGNGRIEAWERAQAKIDFLNAFAPQVLVSIHFNGLSDPSVRGSEVYYSDTGPWMEENRLLARTLLYSLVEALQAAGHAAVDRGIKSDNYKPYGRLYVLGNNDRLLRKGTWQAGALVEVLFLSNPVDVAFLQRPDALEVISQGLLQGIVRFWEERSP